MSKHPEPTETTQKAFIVRLTLREMQCIANAVAGFYNMAHGQELHISPAQTISINSALRKMKDAKAAGADIEVVQSL